MKYLLLGMVFLTLNLNAGFKSPRNRQHYPALPPESTEFEICCQDCMRMCAQMSCLYLPTVCIFCCLGSVSRIHRYFTNSELSVLAHAKYPQSDKIE